MVNRSPKPVKQCSGCLLAKGNRCVVFDYPAQQWADSDCEGFNNPELIKKYLSDYQGEGAHARKQERAEKAKLAKTVETRDGKHQFASRKGVLKDGNRGSGGST